MCLPHLDLLRPARLAAIHRCVHRHSLGGVIYTRTEAPATAPVVTLTTLIQDHLGSTAALLTGTWDGNAFAANTVERQSFAAFGERRDATTWDTLRTAATDPQHVSTLDIPRGFTGHEHLDDSGLIHMNGRIYDPEVGRFLSPDPVVQIPEYSQDFNRYTYTLNNPLNATDPSGFSWISKAFSKVGKWIKENWRTVVVIVVAVVLVASGIGSGIGGAMFASLYGATGMVLTPAAYMAGVGAMTGAVVGGVMGGLSAALHGGSAGDILRGMAVGAVQGAITGGVLHGMETGAQTFADQFAHVVGHGVTGGGANVAMGGKFGDGFLSAAAGAAAGWMGAYKAFQGPGAGNMAARTAMAGAVGGTASVLGGGKFANGAWTASFQHLLNHELTQGRNPHEGGGADYAGGPDPREELAFLNPLYGKEEFMLVTWIEEFQPITSSGTKSNALAMRGYLTLVDASMNVNHYDIVSGGNAIPKWLRGKNSAIPSGKWKPERFYEPLPPYDKSSKSGAFWRHNISFKIGIPTPGTPRSAILFHPTPGYTSGCIGFSGTACQLIDFRDRMIHRKSYPYLFVP